MIFQWFQSRYCKLRELQFHISKNYEVSFKSKQIYDDLLALAGKREGKIANKEPEKTKNGKNKKINHQSYQRLAS